VTRFALVTGPDPGHALVMLGLARALARRGHTTIVATGTQHEQLVTDEGHHFVALPLLAPTDRDDDFGHRLWGRAGQMAPPLRDLLAPLAPEVVVTDTLTTVGRFAAELLRLPWVEVVPHHLLDPDPLVAPVGLGLGPARTPRRRRDDAEIRAAQARDVRAGAELRDRVRAQLGLDGMAPAPVARLLQTLPGLEPRRTQWPPDAHVVGQLAIDPPLAPLEPPPGDGPLVVVTDSTASGLEAPLADLAVRGFAGTDLRAVVTTSRTDLTGGARVIVGRGPHEPLLDAAAVAVGPGGGGFTAKALTRGVPLVVVPLAGDQRETAGRVARSGAGVWLPPERPHPRASSGPWNGCSPTAPTVRRRSAWPAAPGGSARTTLPGWWSGRSGFRTWRDAPVASTAVAPRRPCVRCHRCFARRR